MNAYLWGASKYAPGQAEAAALALVLPRIPRREVVGKGAAVAGERHRDLRIVRRWGGAIVGGLFFCKRCTRREAERDDEDGCKE